MNHSDLIALVKQPEKLTPEHASDLRELTELYPTFVQARMLYTKSLQLSQSVSFVSNLKRAIIYTSNRRWLYYFMHPERKLTAEPYRRESTGISHGDYFDMIETLEREGGDKKQSLKNLADRLKSARAMVVETAKIEIQSSKAEENKVLYNNMKTNSVSEVNENPEILAKKLIHQKKYTEAIEILKKLNLNNPKKSVYFADQIRFLEKVIANSKK